MFKMNHVLRATLSKFLLSIFSPSLFNQALFIHQIEWESERHCSITQWPSPSNQSSGSCSFKSITKVWNLWVFWVSEEGFVRLIFDGLILNWKFSFLFVFWLEQCFICVNFVFRKRKFEMGSFAFVNQKMGFWWLII